MRNKRRRWDAAVEEDPLAGLVNLFDLWMVFSIALLLALVSYFRMPDVLTQQPSSELQQPNASEARLPNSESQKLDHFRESREKLTGEGQRLGTAYRLKSGEVVYVPD